MPHLIMFDLNNPRLLHNQKLAELKLNELKQREPLRHIPILPVLVFNASDSPEDNRQTARVSTRKYAVRRTRWAVDGLWALAGRLWKERFVACGRR